MTVQNEYSGPPRAGLGIRPELFTEVFATPPNVGFFEAHSENYFGASHNRDLLLDLAKQYPLSLHGVGLSLGRADHLDQNHLRQLRELAEQTQPLFISEHLAWSAYSHTHLPDLLPLPLNESSFALVSRHIQAMQDALGRQVLIENPSNYLLFEAAGLPEPEFLNRLAEETGCGLLVDVNNIVVSAANIGEDSSAYTQHYINALDSSFIGQYHLAGHTVVKRQWNGQTTQLLIDTHDHVPPKAVWTLFEQVLDLHGPRPTLFEWDSQFPPLSVLTEQCAKADRLLAESNADLDKKTEHPLSSKETHQHRLKSNTIQAAHSPQCLADFQNDFLHRVLNLDDHLTAAQSSHKERIGVYQSNVFGAINDYLQDVYPALCGVVGERFFKTLCRTYLQNEPPSEGDVHRYGAGLKTYFGHFDSLRELPYLSDLADYEWALHNAYFSELGDCLDPHLFSQEELLNASIALNPSVSVISSPYPIFEIHRQSLPDFEQEVAVDLNQGADQLLVFKQHGVQTHKLSSVYAEFIIALQKNSTLVQAIDVLAGSIKAEDLAQCVSFVLNHNLLSTAPGSTAQTEA